MRFVALPFFGREYAAHVLITQNIESGEPEIKNSGEKFQYNNEFIIHKDLRNTRGKKINNMIQ